MFLTAGRTLNLKVKLQTRRSENSLEVVRVRVGGGGEEGLAQRETPGQKEKRDLPAHCYFYTFTAS